MELELQQRKQLESLIQRSFDGELASAEETHLRELLADNPAAMDCYLEHCQMEAWLSAPGMDELEDDKICSLGTPSSTQPAISESGSSKPPQWTNWAGIAALFAALAGLSTLLQAPPINEGSLSEDARPERPQRTELSPEDAKAWKTLLASTGSDKHPPLTENAVPDARKKERPIRFNRDIRPILSETCFHCHGPDEHGRRADLRLDVVEATQPDKDGWQPIVPGDLDASEVWYRIITDDEDELMPPPESHMELTAEQKDLIKRWIEEGAKYEGHWAFAAPNRPEIPEVSDADWPLNPIDNFVLATLDEQGLKPSAEADRRTLARRLYLDLTGLPPSRDEMHAFLGDSSEDAYEKLVDQLLDSPHFGERMALQWLDQARYADTNGYSIDGGRHMWLWRDWVIQAYNSNLPFDQFTIEQLAGDLLPNPTQNQLIATGFNRNHMITHEGGTIPEENLMNYVADRVQTTSEVFLGLTMACAQCHDHKYDPISQRDYYRFYAFFNALSDKGLDGNADRNSVPNIDAMTPLPHNAEPIRRRLKNLRAELAKPRPALQRAWEAQVQQELAQLGENLTLEPVKVVGAKTPNRNAELISIDETNSVVLKQAHRQAITVSMQMPAGVYNGLRIGFDPSELTEGKLGYGNKPEDKGAFYISGISVSAGQLPSDEIDLYRIVPLADVTASFTGPGFNPRNVMDERSDRVWSPFPKVDTEQHLTLRFTEPLRTEDARYVTVMVNFVSTAPNTTATNAAHLRFYAYQGADDATNYPVELQQLVAVHAAERTPEQKATLARYFRSLAPQLENLRVHIANYDRRLREMTEPHSVMVMDTAAKPRPTFILNRGDYASPTVEVTSSTPEVLPALETKEAATRLDLAKWLVDEDHPLTARVTVNRYWQMLFGTGIVATSADFGSQGEWPSHPELLDWLSVEFRESGWDTKALIRLLVTSATYRQTSAASPELYRTDPANRLLARGPRFRLQAEFIRDAALKSSGMLVPWIGGSSVNPGQPENLWKEVSHFGSTPASAQVHVADEGLERRRRSLYTFWKRTVPPPNMAAFDAPNREVCVMQRSITNTPLQALVLLNDPHFVEASHFLARRMEQAANKEDARAGIEFGFEEVLGRLPKSEELDEMLTAYETQQDWRFLGQLLLNLSETITKG